MNAYLPLDPVLGDSSVSRGSCVEFPDSLEVVFPEVGANDKLAMILNICKHIFHFLQIDVDYVLPHQLRRNRRVLEIWLVRRVERVRPVLKHIESKRVSCLLV